MKIYFAPLEGITDEIYRRVHFESFGGPDRYFIPFISPTQHFTFSSREQKAMSPEENRGIPVIPQVLTKIRSILTRWPAGSGISAIPRSI
ncbi:MAG: hypothetical protein IJA93_03790 [Clostridia bacterium]|nr:hypothetical protein [Clostridia bacterium]